MSGGGKGGGSSSAVVGYKYYWGLHVVIAHEVEAVLGLRFGDKYGWEGVVREGWTGQEVLGGPVIDIDQGGVPPSGDIDFSDDWEVIGGPASVPGLIPLNSPSLFSSNEGGVSGRVDFLSGRPSQPRHPYLYAKVSSLVSAARGVASLVFRQTYWGNNPYMRALGVRAMRAAPGWYFGDYDENWHVIGDSAVPYEGMAAGALDFDMNPAHIIYECLTNARWGRGLPASAVDVPSFAAAATRLSEEKLGLSLVWDAETSIEDFIQTVLEHIDGTLYEIPAEGRVGLKLLRNDYDPAGLTVLGPDQIISVEQYFRPGWGEITNEVKVVWTDDLNCERTVYARDQAAINMQGSVVSETLKMPGIRHAELAQRVADRELAQRTGSLCQATLVATSAARDLKPGDVFLWQWPEYGIQSMVLRVMKVSHGALTDGTIRLTCAQDVFAEPVISGVAAPVPVPWADPAAVPPIPAEHARLDEAPYWHVIKHLTGEYQFLLNEFDEDSAALLILAQAPQSGSGSYSAVFDLGSGYDQDKAVTGIWCAAGVLAEAVNEQATSLVLAETSGFAEVRPGRLLFLGPEILLVQEVEGYTLTVARGVLDTVPAPHSAGERGFFDTAPTLPREEYAAGEEIAAKLLTQTATATLDLEDAPELSVVLAGRFARPYPPGKIRINGQAWPETITGELALTWAHRNRVQQTAYVLTQDEDSVTPEEGTTCTLRLYGETDLLLRTVSGLDGTSYTYAAADELADSGLGRLNTALRFELESVRNGLVSLQRHNRTVLRVG
jgi:hypothetical protein